MKRRAASGWEIEDKLFRFLFHSVVGAMILAESTTPCRCIAGTYDEANPRSMEETTYSISFSVLSDDPGGEELTDNRQATVTIFVAGVDPNALVFRLSAEPTEQGQLVNKGGTGITFIPTDNPLVWRTSVIYWYGVLPDHCCNKYHHAYKFMLTDNHGHSAANTYRVGWPANENPRMIPSHSDNSATTISNPEQVPGITNFYRCLIMFGGFTRSTALAGLPTTDQYAAETMREETYHAQQWMGAVPLSQGGQGDCFTAKGIMWWLNWIGDGPWYVYGTTLDAARALAEDKVMQGELEEATKSLEIWSHDRGFVELKAKEYAGYNAAWKYHCTYEATYGPNPANYTHPAYQ